VSYSGLSSRYNTTVFIFLFYLFNLVGFFYFFLLFLSKFSHQQKVVAASLPNYLAFYFFQSAVLFWLKSKSNLCDTLLILIELKLSQFRLYCKLFQFIGHYVCLELPFSIFQMQLNNRLASHIRM